MFKQYFENTLLNSEFTFGWEYEGFWDKEELPDDYDEIKDYVQDLAKKHFNLTGKCYIDHSVIPNNTELGTNSDGEFETCNYCDGDGRIPCHDCIGEGQIDCPDCSQGEVDCEMCQGTGDYECPDCGGDGHYDNGDTCKVCKGDGSTQCTECNGEGVVDCPTCDGDGTLPCEECMGEGSFSCDECNGTGEIELDDGDALDPYRFEYACFPMSATPENFTKTVEFIKATKDKGIETNSTCGFHCHIGLPKDFYKDNSIMWHWFILQTALNDKYYNMYKKYFAQFRFSSPGNKSKFWDSDYAVNVIEDMRRDLKDKSNGDIKDTALAYFSSQKMRNFRLHPQGTLEWRGPRGFLDKKNWTTFFTITLPQMITFVNTVIDDKQLKYFKGDILESFVSDLKKPYEYTKNETLNFKDFEKFMNNNIRKTLPLEHPVLRTDHDVLVYARKIEIDNAEYKLPVSYSDGKYVVLKQESESAMGNTKIKLIKSVALDKLGIPKKYELVGSIDVKDGKFFNFKQHIAKNMGETIITPMASISSKLNLLDYYPDLKLASFKHLNFETEKSKINPNKVILNINGEYRQNAVWEKGKIPNYAWVNGNNSKNLLITNATGLGLLIEATDIKGKNLLRDTTFDNCAVFVESNAMYPSCMFTNCSINITKNYNKNQITDSVFETCVIKYGKKKVDITKNIKIINLDTFIKEYFNADI